ncbi:VCBS repeat-containing protein, partial [Streptomyces sp. A7024]
MLVPARTAAALACGCLLFVAACDSGGAGGSPAGGARPAAGKAAAQPRPGDFNGDGKDDLALATGRGTVVVYGSAKGLDLRTRRLVHRGFHHLLRADLNADGFTDLVGDGPEPVRGQPRAERFVAWGGPRGLAPGTPLDGTGKELRTGDFNDDGKTDLFEVAGGAADGEPTVLYGPFSRAGKPARSTRVRTGHSEGSFPDRVTVGDFDGDKRADAILRYVSVHPEGDGDATFEETQVLRGGPDGPRLAERVPRGGPERHLDGLPADVNGDGRDDLIGAGFDAYRTAVTLTARLSTPAGPGTGRQVVASTKTPPRLSLGGPHYGGIDGVCAGDTDGDGKADLVASATGANDSNGVIYLAPGIGTAAPGDITGIDLDSPGVPGSN